jgi:hypothetical protein
VDYIPNLDVLLESRIWLQKATVSTSGFADLVRRGLASGGVRMVVVQNITC